VESKKKDMGLEMEETNEISKKISMNIMNFLEMETKKGKLPPNLLPLQSGVGNIANSVCIY
jgi:succinyl-CoA:acetate CoA-transferase